MNRSFILLSIAIIFTILGCTPKLADQINDDYLSEIEQWRAERIASLTRADGWTTLVGLYWLHAGINTFGSREDNGLVMPDAMPDYMGEFDWQGTEVKFNIQPGVYVTEDGKQVSQGLMNSDIEENTTYHFWESYQWHLINRDGKYGIRLKDTLNPARLALKHIPHYPVSEKWKKEAAYRENDESVILDNQVKMQITYPIEGILTFLHQGELYELIAIDGGPDNLFVMISDETTWTETYGGGRYLYVPRPKHDETCYIDFNKAFNPPCVFTDYATCLLPPKANALPFRVEAGEKRYGDH